MSTTVTASLLLNHQTLLLTLPSHCSACCFIFPSARLTVSDQVTGGASHYDRRFWTLSRRRFAVPACRPPPQRLTPQLMNLIWRTAVCTAWLGIIPGSQADINTKYQNIYGHQLPSAFQPGWCDAAGCGVESCAPGPAPRNPTILSEHYGSGARACYGILRRPGRRRSRWRGVARLHLAHCATPHITLLYWIWRLIASLGAGIH